MGLGNLNDPPSPLTRPCRPSTLCVSNNNQVGAINFLVSYLWELLNQFDLTLLLSSPMCQTMKLGANAVHMVSTLTQTLSVSVNRWQLVSI